MCVQSLTRFLPHQDVVYVSLCVRMCIPYAYVRACQCVCMYVYVCPYVSLCVCTFCIEVKLHRVAGELGTLWLTQFNEARSQSGIWSLINSTYLPIRHCNVNCWTSGPVDEAVVAFHHLAGHFDFRWHREDAFNQLCFRLRIYCCSETNRRCVLQSFFNCWFARTKSCQSHGSY